MSARARSLGQRKSGLRSALVRAAVDLAPRTVLVQRGSRTARRVALTFDDGPDELTTLYLDELDRLGVRATFFLVGQMCLKFPASVRDIIARGHEVASHGHSHRSFPSLSREELAAELAAVAKLLPPSALARPIVRPPRGAVSAVSLLRCAAAGYTTVLWSLDSDDCRTTAPDVVAARVAESRPGEIVLLHEGQTWTLDALPTMVARLRDAGLEIVTVGEMLG